MKGKFTLTLFAIGIVCYTAVADNGGFAEKTKLVEAMTEMLAERDLPGFLKAVKEQGWDTPHIRSVYWIEQMATNKAEEIRYETAKREFGLALAKKIDEMALESISVTNTEARASLASHAFDIANWIGATKGYGNFQIARRVDDLGYTQIGYLAANLNFSTNRIDTLLKRAMTQETHLSFRLAVLDDESPVPVGIKRSGSANEVYERLLKWWGDNLRKADEWCKDKKGTKIFNCAKYRAEMPKEVAFFADEDGGGNPFTVVSLWEHKRHFTHCINSSLEWRKWIDNLYLFRQKVGAFPSEMPLSW